MVGADFYEIDFKKERWFMEYSWDIRTEEKFRRWFFRYLKRHPKARQEIFGLYLVDSRMRINAVNQFIMNYGWKYWDM